MKEFDRQLINGEVMMTEVVYTKPNIITQCGHVALAVLASSLRADLEILTNEETGDEIASIARFGATPDDDFELHFMPDPFGLMGYGWVGVSDGEAIVSAPSLSLAIKRYRDLFRERN